MVTTGEPEGTSLQIGLEIDALHASGDRKGPLDPAQAM